MKNITLLLFLLTRVFVNAQAPVFEWVKQYGGTVRDQSKSVVTDAQGNVYTTGIFNQTADLDPSATVLNFTAFGTNDLPDVYVMKSDPMGNLIWVKRIGGVGVENVFAIFLDTLGNVYTTGSSNRICDFDPSDSAFILDKIGTVDLFISKLDKDGNFVWAKRLGGASAFVSGIDLVADSAQNVYVTGNFNGTVDFDSSLAVSEHTTLGLMDTFVLKLNSSGDYGWSVGFGSINSDSVSSIALDSSNNIITTGQFSNTVDFDPSASTFNIASTFDAAYNSWATNTFISKLDNNGNFVWAKSFKSTDIKTNLPYSAVLDNLNNIYIGVRFAGTVDFDTSVAVQNATAMRNDTAIVKLNDSGNLLWIKQFSGISFASNQPSAICLDALNNVYTTGRINTGTTDFDPGVGVSNLTCLVDFDIYISKLDSNGNFVWVKQIAGDSKKLEESFDIVVDVNNNVYTIGIFTGTLDFDQDLGISTLTNFGESDGFTQKMSQSSILSTKENDLKNNIQIYPNPTSNNLNILLEKNFEEATLKIISILGQTVFEKSNVSGSNIKIDVSSLNAGTYIIQVKDRISISNSKFIKR